MKKIITTPINKNKKDQVDFQKPLTKPINPHKTIKKIVTKNITLQISDTIAAAEVAASARKLIILF